MNEKQNNIWSLGEDISAKDNNVRMIGVNSEWVILVNHIQFAVGEKPCTTKRESLNKHSEKIGDGQSAHWYKNGIIRIVSIL